MDRLDDIVKLVGSNAIGRKEGQLVVQKYIGNTLENVVELTLHPSITFLVKIN